MGEINAGEVRNLSIEKREVRAGVDERQFFDRALLSENDDPDKGSFDGLAFLARLRDLGVLVFHPIVGA